jgi:hypothetical protein
MFHTPPIRFVDDASREVDAALGEVAREAPVHVIDGTQYAASVSTLRPDASA